MGHKTSNPWKGIFSSPPDASTLSEKKLVIAIILAGYLVRFYNLMVVDAIEIDGVSYAEAARFFASGSFSSALRCVRVPFYSCLTGVFHLVIPDVEVAGRIVSLLCSILLVIMVYFFCKRHGGERPALWGAALSTLHPLITTYSTRVLSESLATLLFTGAGFSFYEGWVDKKSRWFAISGALLTLAYLTRPEYIIYFAPLTLLLLSREREKRPTRVALFLVCFLILGGAFLLYIKSSTGYWVIDKKMLHWGSATDGRFSDFSYLFGRVSPLEALSNVPEVLWNFGAAIFLPIVLLAILGFGRVDQNYKLLLLSLIAVHVVARAFVSHSTPRYSVEFVPLVLVPAVQGVLILDRLYSNYRYRRQLLVFSMAALLGLSFAASVSPWLGGRELQKETGLYLKGLKGSLAVASRLPLEPFYAGRKWVDLNLILGASHDCKTLQRLLIKEDVGFVVVDDSLEKERHRLFRCLAHGTMLKKATNADGYVRVFRPDGTGMD